MSNLEAKPAEVGIALAAEIRDGGKYLLGVDRNLTADQADQIQGVLRKRFPNSTFALMSPGLRVTTETVPLDLIGAVERARLKARENWLLSTHPETKVAYYGAMVGMELLKRELADTPERDGAGELPAEAATSTEPVSEPLHPAPSRPIVCLCAQINVDSSADVPGSQWIPGFRDPSCPYHGCRCTWEQRVNVMTEPYSKPGPHHAPGCPMRQS